MDSRVVELLLPFVGCRADIPDDPKAFLLQKIEEFSPDEAAIYLLEVDIRSLQDKIYVLEKQRSVLMNGGKELTEALEKLEEMGL